ncbi:MAG: F0F1 ATP synthase subunit B [Geoalkalibacter sp.]|uniref:F0F1 ATP synthase subunit B n=1 Tax=Geoalkalibacter sp. TaxID=3041440 RepID=UPI003D0BB1B9
MGMRTLRATVVAVLTCTVVLAAASAMAAGGGHQVDSGVLLKDFIFRVLNFAVVVGILVYFVTKPIKRGLASRRENLEKALEDAEKARREAEARHAEYEAKLKDASEEIAAIEEEIRREGELERERIIANAREMAEKMAKDSERAATQEVAKATRELREEAAALAISLAREMLKKNFTDADQKRLVDEYMQKMHKAGELS